MTNLSVKSNVLQIFNWTQIMMRSKWEKIGGCYHHLSLKCLRYESNTILHFLRAYYVSSSKSLKYNTTWFLVCPLSPLSLIPYSQKTSFCMKFPPNTCCFLRILNTDVLFLLPRVLHPYSSLSPPTWIVPIYLSTVNLSIMSLRKLLWYLPIMLS